MERLDIEGYVKEQFDNNILPSLQDFIKIPNTSKMYDPEWKTNGLLEKAASHLINWAKRQEIPGLKAEMIQAPGKTPLVFIEIDATDGGSKTICFYGHFDKQPHMSGWASDSGPLDPTIKGDKLFGRGSVDDGYSLYASVLSIMTLKKLGLPHGKIYILIEGDEESEGDHLLYYLFDYKLKDRFTPQPDLIICLDSFGFNNMSLTVATSLRGFIGFKLGVQILEDPVHSGDASGVVPDTFRLLRGLLERIEDSRSGAMVDALRVDIPSDKYKQMEQISMANIDYKAIFNMIPSSTPVGKSSLANLINRLWEPQMTIIGADGIPPTSKAGNVIRPSTTLSISIRTPPTLDTKKATEYLEKVLTENPPYGAKITFEATDMNDGWDAPVFDSDFETAVGKASKLYIRGQEIFGIGPLYAGCGGSIPFIKTLSDVFPSSKFLVTGCALPGCNAHGPNEWLDMSYCKKIISVVTNIISKL